MASFVDLTINYQGKTYSLSKDQDAFASAIASSSREATQLHTVEDTIKLNDQKILTYSHLENLTKELLSAAAQLRRTSAILGNQCAFDTKSINILGMAPEVFRSYLEVTSTAAAPNGEYNIQVHQMAEGEIWASIPFSSKSASVTQPQGKKINPSLFTEGTFQIEALNNRKSTVQKFQDSTEPIVFDVATTGKFKSGSFSLNNKPVVLNNGSSLNDIIQTINDLNAGVIASFVDNTLTLQSEERGIENNFLIEDPHLVLTSLAKFDRGDVFVVNPERVPITLNAEDSLEAIAKKINSVTDKTGLEAIVTTITSAKHGSYNLVLQSVLSGVQNAFKIFDGQLLDGKNTGKVFNDILNSLKTDSLDNKPKKAEIIIQEAQDCSITVNGIQIARPTNLISDYINGITFKIQSTPPRKLSFAIVQDSNIVISNISNLVEKYNKLAKFIQKEESCNTSALLLGLVEAVGKLVSNGYVSLTDGFELDANENMIEYATLLTITNRNLEVLEKKLISSSAEIRKAFDVVLEGDTDNLMVNPVIFSKDASLLKIQDKRKTLQDSDLTYNFDIDKNRVICRTANSLAFSHKNKPVVMNPLFTNTLYFRAGTFYINNIPITLTAWDDLDTICNKINQVKERSNIIASVEKIRDAEYFLSLQSTNQFAKSAIAIRDKANVLQDVFSIVRYTKPFTLSELKLGKSFELNGKTIATDAKMKASDLVKKINEFTHATNVFAELHTDIINRDLYHIIFKSNVLSEININDPHNFFYGKLVESNGGMKFFDTTFMVEATVQSNSQLYKKDVDFVLSDNTSLSDGILTFPNTEEDLVIAGFNLLYNGTGFEKKKFKFTQGSADRLVNLVLQYSGSSFDRNTMLQTLKQNARNETEHLKSEKRELEETIDNLRKRTLKKLTISDQMRKIASQTGATVRNLLRGKQKDNDN